MHHLVLCFNAIDTIAIPVFELSKDAPKLRTASQLSCGNTVCVLCVNCRFFRWTFPLVCGLIVPAKGGGDMRSIIEELYYGNINPSDRDIIRGGTYSHILNLLTRNEDELVQTLTQAQQEKFEKFKDCASELGDKNEMMSFVLGFKLGMRLAVEAMISIDNITEPKMT